MDTFVVAQIEKDFISEDQSDLEFKQDGREFEFEAMRNWWGWGDIPENPKEFFDDVRKTTFKLYDDDDECYYDGWLINDDECIVQQFVLKWAESYAGCTTILIKKNDEAGFIQEIG